LGLDLQQAINLPNFGSRNGPTELEQGRTPDAVVQGLKARGHEVLLNEQTSGLQGVQRHAGGWLGAADPRREGSPGESDAPSAPSFTMEEARLLHAVCS
jgi:gamma-glutamyltranspeptidase/glutathione hydrolase